MDIMMQSFAIYGLAIVISFIVAVVIKGIVATLTRKEAVAKPAAAAAAAPASAAVDQRHLDIAAISAAVYAVLGAHRIVRVEDARRQRVWGLEGRMIHQTSHQVQTRPGPTRH